MLALLFSSLPPPRKVPISASAQLPVDVVAPCLQPEIRDDSFPPNLLSHDMPLPVCQACASTSSLGGWILSKAALIITVIIIIIAATIITTLVQAAPAAFAAVSAVPPTTASTGSTTCIGRGGSSVSRLPPLFPPIQNVQELRHLIYERLLVGTELPVAIGDGGDDDLQLIIKKVPDLFDTGVLFGLSPGGERGQI